jgi:YVTN family beta-propeller protein
MTSSLLRPVTLAALVALAALAAAQSALAADYKVLARYPIGGGISYDYLRVDPETRRLFVAHGTQVEVLDADTGKPVGKVGPTSGAHGIAFVPGRNRGFITSGLDRTVIVFEPSTLAIVKVIPGLGVKPDAIEYDPDTKKIYVANGTSGGISVIDPEAMTIVATVPLVGKLEGMVFDGRGKLFVNTEDKSMVQVVDLASLKAVAAWPVAPVEGGTGLAIDRATHRLFVAGGNNLLAVLDSDTGAVVATPAIGEDPDGDAFDPATGLIFTSNVEGTLSVLHEDSADKYSPVQTLPTAYGARTIAYDVSTGRIFVPFGEFAPAVKAAAGEPEAKRVMKPGTFGVIAIGK